MMLAFGSSFQEIDEVAIFHRVVRLQRENNVLERSLVDILLFAGSDGFCYLLERF